MGLRAWLDFVRQNPYVYHIIWESLYIDKDLFREYYEDFCRSYMRGIDEAKKMGQIRADIDSEVLAYTLMGTSNFIALNWGLFKKHPMDTEYVVESFMRIIEEGIFTDHETGMSETAKELPIRIEVEFEDNDEWEQDDECEEEQNIPTGTWEE